MEVNYLLTILLIITTRELDASRIRKRLVSPPPTTPAITDNVRSNNDSSTFHINVSAGYGVQQHLENSTSDYVNENKKRSEFVPSQSYQFEIGNFERPRQNSSRFTQKTPSYKFKEKVIPPSPFPTQQIAIDDQNQEETQQQNPQQSLTFRSNYYQVAADPITDNSNQRKVYNFPKSFQFQPSYVHSRTRPSLKELHNVVNHAEYDHDLGKPKSAKIVEIVRVPAVYELHLQDNNHEAQRFININPWVSKLNGFNSNKPQSQPIRPNPSFYEYNQPAAVKYVNQYNQNEGYQQDIDYNYNFQQVDNSLIDGYYQQSIGNKYEHHGSQNAVPSLGPTILVMPQQQQQPVHYHQSFTNYRNQVPKSSRPYKTLQNYVRGGVPEGFKKVQEPASILDFGNYKKPQAIHEVPAPMLNQGHHRTHNFNRYKSTPLPIPIYAHQEPTIETVPSRLVYSHQSSQTIPGPLDDLVNLTPIQSSIPYQNQNSYKGQVDSVPNDYGLYQDASNLIGDTESGKIVNLPQPLLQQLQIDQQKEDIVESQPQYGNPNEITNVLQQYLLQSPSTFIDTNSNHQYNMESRQPQVFSQAYQEEEIDKNRGMIEMYRGNHPTPKPGIRLMMLRAPQDHENHPVIPRFESMKVRDGTTMIRKQPNYHSNKNLDNGGRYGGRIRRHGPMEYIIFIKERTSE